MSSIQPVDMPAVRRDVRSALAVMGFKDSEDAVMQLLGEHAVLSGSFLLWVLQKMPTTWMPGDIDILCGPDFDESKLPKLFGQTFSGASRGCITYTPQSGCTLNNVRKVVQVTSKLAMKNIQFVFVDDIALAVQSFDLSMLRAYFNYYDLVATADVLRSIQLKKDATSAIAREQGLRAADLDRLSKRITKYQQRGFIITLPDELKLSKCLEADLEDLKLGSVKVQDAYRRVLRQTTQDAIDLVRAVHVYDPKRLSNSLNAAFASFGYNAAYLNSLLGENAVLTGSFLLWVLKCQPKTWTPNGIDIFCGPNFDDSSFEHYIKAGYQVNTTTSVGKYENCGRIVKIVNVCLTIEKKLQFVFVDDLVGAISEFDLSIVQAWWDGKNVFGLKSALKNIEDNCSTSTFHLQPEQRLAQAVRIKTWARRIQRYQSRGFSVLMPREITLGDAKDGWEKLTFNNKNLSDMYTLDSSRKTLRLIADNQEAPASSYTKQTTPTTTSTTSTSQSTPSSVSTTASTTVSATAANTDATTSVQNDTQLATKSSTSAQCLLSAITQSITQSKEQHQALFDTYLTSHRVIQEQLQRLSDYSAMESALQAILDEHGATKIMNETLQASLNQKSSEVKLLTEQLQQQQAVTQQKNNEAEALSEHVARQQVQICELKQAVLHKQSSVKQASERVEAFAASLRAAMQAFENETD